MSMDSRGTLLLDYWIVRANDINRNFFVLIIRLIALGASDTNDQWQATTQIESVEERNTTTTTIATSKANTNH